MFAICAGRSRNLLQEVDDAGPGALPPIQTYTHNEQPPVQFAAGDGPDNMLYNVEQVQKIGKDTEEEAMRSSAVHIETARDTMEEAINKVKKAGQNTTETDADQVPPREDGEKGEEEDDEIGNRDHVLGHVHGIHRSDTETGRERRVEIQSKRRVKDSEEQSNQAHVQEL